MEIEQASALLASAHSAGFRQETRDFGQSWWGEARGVRQAFVAHGQPVDGSHASVIM